MSGAAPGTWRHAAGDFAGWSRANHLGWVAGGWAVLLALVALAHRADVTLAAAAATYLLLAVYALQLVAGDTAQPSLGHAAFLAVGAYLAAFLRLHAGVDGLVAAAVSAVAGGVLGWLLGRGVTRLRPAFLALLTWSLGWAVFLALGAFPEATGGAAGIPLRSAMRIRWEILGVDVVVGDAGHLVLGTLLLALGLLLYRAALTSVVGRGWAALRDSHSLAASLGHDVAATRRNVFALSAGVACLAGALAAQLVEVVDPTRYDPLQSLNLLAAVLVGAPLGFFGPVVGAALVSGAPLVVGEVAATAGAPTGSVRELTATALTVAALVLSARLRRGTDPTRAPRRPGAAAPEAPPDPGTAARRKGAAAAARGGPVVLLGRGLRVDFDGLRALDGVDIAIRAGAIHGLIGPNGSGKSTLLRCLAGRHQGSGTVSLAGQPVDSLPEFRRVRAGVAGTFQRTAVMPSLLAWEHVEVGLRLRYRHASPLQAVLRTPAYRDEAAAGRARAVEVLATFGLEEYADRLPGTLPAGRQRLLQIATAAATAPRVLLLDEPSAGMDVGETAVLARALSGLAAGGTGILLIEHNMSFLGGLTSEVTVLDGGRVLFEGTPARAARNPAVRRAYLGAGAGSLVSPAAAPAPRSVPRPRARPAHDQHAGGGHGEGDDDRLTAHRRRRGRRDPGGA
jgi:branched-chain amino acid transport system permease protein